MHIFQFCNTLVRVDNFVQVVASLNTGREDAWLRVKGSEVVYATGLVGIGFLAASLLGVYKR